MRSPQDQRTPRLLVWILVVSGFATIVLGIVLGTVVAPALFAVAALSIVDFALASAYASGRLTMARGASASSPDPARDPSYNPYARED